MTGVAPQLRCAHLVEESSVVDEELVGRIEAVMFADPTSIATPERIAEEVTEYIEEFIELLEEDVPAGVTSLPALLDDGSVIEIALTIQRIVDAGGNAAFSLKVAGSADQAQLLGLLELAKYNILSDED